MSKPPKKPFGKPFRPRSENSDRPDRPSRSFGNKPFGKKPFDEKSERPRFRAKEDVAPAESGYGLYKREGGDDRPRRPKTFDKPFREKSDRPFRAREDKPFRERPERSDRNERPVRPERSERPDRERSERPFRPRGEKPFRPREDKPFRERSERRERSVEDRPPRRDFKPHEGREGVEGSGDRPRTFKKRFDKPFKSDRKPAFGKKPFTRRPWEDEKPKPKRDRDFPQSRHQADPDNDLIHGHHAVAAALQNDRRDKIHLWVTENALARLVEENVTLPSEIETVHPRLLDHMLVGQDAVHQGIILEAKPLDQPQLNKIEKGGLVVLLDQVTDPHNVGAILRTCAAFGVSAVVSPARHAAAENGTLFKAASGAYEHVPLVKVTNLARAIEELKGYGFRIIGLDSEAEASMDEVESVRPLALVLGAEGKGLRELTRESCDQVARLEMTGPIKSLNVSIATAVSLYALTR